MKTPMPMFGVAAGMATAVGYLPHIVFLAVIAVSQSRNITPFFLMFTVIARILGDWVFWSQMFPSRLESTGVRSDWRSSVKDILFSKPTSIGAMFDMIVDLGIDALLIYMAIKASASPVLIFLVLSGCQAIGAFAYGMIIYVFSRKGLRLFSMAITALATFAALEMNGVIPKTSHAGVLGLDTLAKPIAILLILGAKCLFTGTTVIGKTNIAETIKLETMKELTT